MWRAVGAKVVLSLMSSRASGWSRDRTGGLHPANQQQPSYNLHLIFAPLFDIGIEGQGLRESPVATRHEPILSWMSVGPVEPATSSWVKASIRLNLSTRSGRS